MDILALQEAGRRNWERYAKEKRAAKREDTKGPSIETYYGSDNAIRELPAVRARDEMTQRAFHPEMFFPGFEGLEKARIETGPESPGGRGGEIYSEAPVWRGRHRTTEN